jgi:hypothetical protein
MTARQIQIGITTVAGALTFIHLIWPHVALDGVSVTLILIAILPWLNPLFKSIELPGGFKVEFNQLERTTERADRAGLLAAPSIGPETHEYSFQAVAQEDPNLALAGLRLEIEKRLIQIANKHGVDAQNRGIARLLQALAERRLITSEARSVLADMIQLLNSAVHGATVDFRAASWAIEIGPRLLKSLDERTQA